MGVIFVRKITTLLVIGEISKLKKNQYGHIDRGFLRLKVNKSGRIEQVRKRGLPPLIQIQAAAGGKPLS